MKEVKISTGFTYQFSDDVLDDYDILQTLVAVDKGHPEKIYDVVPLLFGDDAEKFIDSYRDPKTHKAKASEIGQGVKEILEALNGKK